MCEAQGQTMYYTASKSQPILVLTLTSDAFDSSPVYKLLFYGYFFS